MTGSSDPSPPAAGRWQALGLTCLAQSLCMAVWFSASAATPQLQIEWQLSGGQVAALTAAVQLGFVAGALASALLVLSDRVPAHRLIATSALVAALANAGVALVARGFGDAAVLRFVTGICLAGIYPPGMKLAASWFVERRGLAIGALIAALTLGKAAPHALSALPLAGATGEAPWRAVLLAASGLAALGSLLAAASLRPGPYLAESAPFDWRFAGRPLAHLPTRLANYGYLGHMWELYAMWVWTPLALLASYEAAGWSSNAARLAGFATIVAGAPGSVLAGLLADRWGRTLVASGSLLVSGTCCLLAGWALPHPGWLTLLCLVWGFAVVADSAQFSAAVSELSDPRYVGTALTVQTSLGFLLTVVALQLGPWLSQSFGWGGRFAILALGPAFGLTAMWRLRRLPESVRLARGRR